MKMFIYSDYNRLSDQAADAIIRLIKLKPDAVLCLASGDTPLLTYTLVAQKAADAGIDFTRCMFIGLDEWMGVPPANEGSCHFFLQHNIFEPLKISNHQIHLFNALSKDLLHECQLMDKIISAKGGIDLIVVGVGMNGHIGFNEPGVSPDHYAHVVDLDEVTQTVGQKYFRQPMALTRGITLGLKHFMEARSAIMMASGAKKADVIRKAVDGDISPEMPASIIRNHANGYVMLDEAAASALANRHQYPNPQKNFKLI